MDTEVLGQMSFLLKRQSLSLGSEEPQVADVFMLAVVYQQKRGVQRPSHSLLKQRIMSFVNDFSYLLL